MPKTGDLELVHCPSPDHYSPGPHVAAGNVGTQWRLETQPELFPPPDATLWIRMEKPGGSSFLMPTGHLFLGYSREVVASTNNYEWRSEWIALGADEDV